MSSQTDYLAPNHLRSEQITIIARWTSVLAICSVTSGIIVLRRFWATAPHAFLVTFFFCLCVLHGLAVVSGILWLRKTSREATPFMMRSRVVVSGLIAMVWASVPIMLMPAASTDQRQLLIYIGSGLISSSILLAPMMHAALVFLFITTIGVLLPMPFIDQSITLDHAWMILLYTFATWGVVHNQARDFSKRVLNELAQEEQAGIIGLLLHDFEENASDFLWETDAEFHLQHVSDRLAQILGCGVTMLEGSSFGRWIEQGSAIVGTENNSNASMLACLADRQPFRDLQVSAVFDGQEYWFSLTGKPVVDRQGIFRGYRGVGSDMTALRRSDKRIVYLAGHDSLTSLPNRAQFHDALARACADNIPFALLCLDLDGFKTVNDTLGHGMGDALLVAVSGRLRTCLRDGDMVARLGGDEFAVLQVGGDAPAAAILAQRLINHVAEPYQLGRAPTSIGVSIGITLATATKPEPEELLKGADLALYHSKSEGRGTWSFFEDGMALRAQERHALQVDLRHAIDADELFLEYQPITDFTSANVTGAEALVRWQHPVRGCVSPVDFIPAAEESGLIVALGAWVLRRACEEASTWEGNARVAVNLSPLQFRDPGLLALVDQVLAETGLPGHRLELEITESVFLEKVDNTLACLHALRSRGIHIALDDFGTGYSSLSYLRSFPFDKVKIDQSFIRDLNVNDDAITIVQAIVGMASSLGMRTTGEGVETQGQAKLLQATGCTQVQGYLFGRPCSPTMISTLINACVHKANAALALTP
ncbi:MAG: putative bifunctional diguanylate cyclase/phosphodiesterase [Janthinobacterium lividum]